MSKLVVTLYGKEISVVELVDEAQYIAGRGQDCQISLTDQKGISRHHIKIYQESGEWIAQLISKYGSLIYDGEATEAIQLSDGISFQVPPYEFTFKDKAALLADKQLQVTDEDNSIRSSAASIASQNSTTPTDAMSASHKNNPNISSEEQKNNNMILTNGPQPPLNQPEGNLEATSPGITNLVPYLRIRYPDKDRDEILELKGNLWVAGRDLSCEIPINDKLVSRRHFEITQTNKDMYITDLGSANGTEVNNQPITSHEPHQLNSGDQITIMNLIIVFEMRDIEFKNKLALAEGLPPQVQMSAHTIPDNKMSVNANFSTPLPQSLNLYFDSEGPSAVKIPASQSKNIKAFIFNLKKNKIRLVLVILIPIILIGLLLDNKDQKNQNQKELSSISKGASFNKLTLEQKTAVKNIFNLARGQYIQGNYEFCLSELKNLHKIVPFYEDSKTLQSQCITGLEMIRENQEIERNERERLIAYQKIQDITKKCQSEMTSHTTIKQAKDCLIEAIELDPENPSIVAILYEIEQREITKKQRALEKNAYRNRVHAGQAQYNRAKLFYKKGKLRKSIHEYKKYLSYGYPDPKNLNSIAKRELATVQKKLNKKVQKKLSLCKNHYENKEYKLAIKACDIALKEDPNHSNVKSTRSQILSDLRQEMKSIYEDSILEESLGEIEGAKKKWQKILQNDIPSDDYYKKAKRKLRKYGIGI